MCLCPLAWIWCGVCSVGYGDVAREKGVQPVLYVFADGQTLQPVKALAVTRQELHTVTAGYPRMKEEFTRVARTMVSSFKLPIRLPATDAELKREASRSRRQSLSIAVKSGLWRRFSHVRGVAAAVVWACCCAWWLSVLCVCTR